MKRPEITRANACFLLAGAALVCLTFGGNVLFDALRRAGLILNQLSAQCVLDAVYYLPFLLLPACLCGRKSGFDAMRLGPVGGADLVLCVLAAMICALLGNDIAVLWSMALEGLGARLSDLTIEMKSTSDLMRAVVATGVVPGICEELLFRGVVFSGYEGGGTRRALLISSLLFASLHGSVQGFPVQFGMGMLLGLVVLRTGSLYAGMMLHTAYNSFLLMLSYAVRNVEAPQGETIWESIGGLSALGTLLFEMAALTAVILFILKRLKLLHPEAGGEKPRARLGMSVPGWILLTVGALMPCALYALDFLSMAGKL